MKLHQSQHSGDHLFSAYGDGFVEIQQTRHACPLIVCADRVAPWQAPGFDALSASHFEELLPYGPEVVLLGTGKIQRFPHPRLYAALSAARIGLEVMDTQAACRTYNILQAEGRKVLIALFP